MSYFVFYCCDKHHDQKQRGEERISFTLQIIVCHEGKSQKVLKQEPGFRNLTRVQGGILHTGLFCLLFDTIQDWCLSRYIHPTLIINQEIVLQTYLQVNLIEALSQLRVSLPRWFSLMSNWQKRKKEKKLKMYTVHKSWTRLGLSQFWKGKVFLRQYSLIDYWQLNTDWVKGGQFLVILSSK